jgi:hypothetical protein
MGLTPLGTPPTMTHHTYSDDFQELLPLFIHWMGGLFLWWRDGSHPPGHTPNYDAPYL